MNAVRIIDSKLFLVYFSLVVRFFYGYSIYFSPCSIIVEQTIILLLVSERKTELILKIQEQLCIY